MSSVPSIICLMGPTASGKTDLAMALVKQAPIEIISVDSAMIYRGMDIGTGKPTAEELKVAPHHLIDIRDPSQPYSAAEFRNDALACISDIHQRNRIPLLVGGTLLYFRALLQGLSEAPSADPSIRARLSEEGERLGWAALHERLKIMDPAAALRIHPNDPQRIQRALEVYEITGRSLSSFWESDPKPSETVPSATPSTVLAAPAFKVHSFALMPAAHERAILHQRIEQRFMKMLERGFIQEGEALYNRGDLHLDLPSMRAVGYRQIWLYLAGQYTYEEMIQRACAATRQLAKRQLTWLRKLTDVQILNLTNTHLDPMASMIHSLSLKSLM